MTNNTNIKWEAKKYENLQGAMIKLTTTVDPMEWMTNRAMLGLRDELGAMQRQAEKEGYWEQLQEEVREIQAAK